MFTHIANEIQKSEVAKPIVVVNQFRGVVAVKVEELFELCTDACDVVRENVLR
jgi:hypothetical protein